MKSSPPPPQPTKKSNNLGPCRVIIQDGQICLRPAIEICRRKLHFAIAMLILIMKDFALCINSNNLFL